MTKLLPIAAALLSTFALNAQVNLFTENFNGNSHQFTLNTTDMSSAAAGTNTWVVNNSYTGGSGSVVCQSFTLNYTVANTVQQPAQIAGNPTSKYMHILSTEAQTDGITNGCYQASDGFCYFDENYFTKMTSDISTVGYTGTTLSFWWLCGGAAGSAYGEVYYSTDGGVTWTAGSGQYLNNSGAWQMQSFNDSNFDNEPMIRFGFRFVNTSALNAADPGFCLDDIMVDAQLANGIDNGVTHETLTAFPNPANDVLTLQSNMTAAGDQMNITITDVTGAIVRRESYNYTTLIEISTAELSAGSYFLTAESGENKSTIRFSVTH